MSDNKVLDDLIDNLGDDSKGGKFFKCLRDRQEKIYPESMVGDLYMFADACFDRECFFNGGNFSDTTGKRFLSDSKNKLYTFIFFLGAVEANAYLIFTAPLDPELAKQRKTIYPDSFSEMRRFYNEDDFFTIEARKSLCSDILNHINFSQEDINNLMSYWDWENYDKDIFNMIFKENWGVINSFISGIKAIFSWEKDDNEKVFDPDGCIEHVDLNFKLLMDELKSRGYIDNTYIWSENDE